jgi:hypothetical protein
MKRKTIIVALAFIAAAAAIGLFLHALTDNTAGGSSSASGFPVSINEIMSSNSSYYDDSGNAYDWIELYNSSDIDINLSNYKLTDNERKVRYTFPNDASIHANGYYVVWCKNNDTDETYADFSISKSGDETLVLMNSRSIIIDRVVTLALDQNAAMARTGDGEWDVRSYGTPGYENSEQGYADYLAAHQAVASAVRLNEVMTSNQSYMDANQNSSDWVELYNCSDDVVDLSGCRLSDKAGSEGYVFPDGTTLDAGEYLVVYCDGTTTGNYYAPFSLSADGGEELVLYSNANIVLDQLVTPAMQADTSLARDEDGVWQVSTIPTPGFENTQSGYEAYLASVSRPGSDIRITEIMASNLSCLADSSGAFYDWIELTNAGSETVGLDGYFLSDREDKPLSWALPVVTLEPGERIVIFASGDNDNADGLHADFSLNRHSGVVTLCDQSGQIVSSVNYEELDDNVSYALDETSGEWAVSFRATPGFSNDEDGYFAFSEQQSSTSALLINEVMTGNDSQLEQSHGVYCDWIELKNTTDETIDLSNYSITDNLDKTEYCTLPSGKLKPGKRIVLLCTGDTPLTKSSHDQIALSLNAESDQLYLLDESGNVVDYVTLTDIPYAASCGRMPDQNGLFYFSSPTPGEENSGGYRLISGQPTASAAPGIYNDISSLTISLSAEGDIYYTLDGETPTTRSNRYDSPITITETTVIRAIAIDDGKMASSAVTLNYFINENHSLPIVAVTTDPDNLYDDSIGILADANLFDRTVERFANVAFYSDNSSFATDCGFKLHGAGSRGRLSKKSFKVVFRARYGGVSPLEFPLFEDNGITTFYSFLIRNSQDYSRTFLRDELVSKIAYSASSELLVQDTRFCVFYLNGEYRGIYCIKEAFSSGYFAEHYGVGKESVELQRGYITDGTEFSDLLEYAKTHDLSVAEYYNYVKDQVSLESLIDWCIFEGYTANTDLSVNVRYYRSTEYGDNRWHYALFDLDYGFGGDATFEHILGNAWHGTLFKALLKNAEFQDMFLTRMAYLLENCLTDEAVMASFDKLSGEIADEVPRERDRWPTNGTFTWEDHLNTLERRILSGRVEQLKESIADAMGISLNAVERYFTGDGE